MNPRSLRPRYFYNRLRQIAFTRTFPDTPWLAPAAVHLLESWLRPTDTGIEWGSGRSTVWFASRVAKVLSIEDNSTWHAQVTRMLAEKGLSAKVDYRLIPCPHQEHEEPATAEYASVAETIPDGSVDFALVDGNVRATCMPIAIRKVKPGGLLILDNANRYLPNISLGKPATIHEPRFEFRSENWEKISNSLKSWCGDFDLGQDMGHAILGKKRARRCCVQCDRSRMLNFNENVPYRVQ